ncbi:uncharacterized protein LOC110465528 isoform X2 [Mizuhopecten yessoensis]|uniref:uncharacterized protein LOC110465528 isoform X2 n=1 Tax=Mizuhopecten yessoensis TaxID=6573 RepID=UPI000B459372|nr:uncharacterized protein LOC110465528 isoform X2 [Mizuhopecten yessoensis]
MRKVVNLGLRTTYMKREGVYCFTRKLLALPFLPATEIEPAFARMLALASTPELRQLVEYLHRVWFHVQLSLDSSQLVMAPQDEW